MTPWTIHGVEFGNCNCCYACPCQFNSLPNEGFCEASVGYAIDKGHHGEVSLNGVRMAAQYKWPGPVHEGNGTMQLFVDRSASTAQRKAALAIMSGEDTEEAATMWWIFSAMSPNKLEPQFCDIEIDVDIPARRGLVRVSGAFEARGEPILNPVTGAEHRVRINLPNGFEYTFAEIGSGSTRSQGALPINLDATYGQFCELHLSHKGVIRDAA